MRLGLPYKGSKNIIAKWIIDNLPPAETFVDLFCGGCAVTHAAMLEGKYKNIIINDIDSRMPQFFIDCINGKYTVENHKEWVSREDFFRLKDTDAYIALVWSFSNNGVDYLYGKDIEDMKRAYHKAVYFDDTDALSKYGYKISKSDKTSIYGKYLDYQRQIKKQTPSIQLEIVTRQIEVERLQSLQSLQTYGADYQQVDIPFGG